MGTEKAVFAAGCFWGVEDAFRRVPGVVGTSVGYTGGKTSNPTYEQVCTDRTGHAEAVEVEYDPAVVDYRHLLDVFWAVHDPTQLNRQGPDIGTQYRSAIFTSNPAQEHEALASLAELEATGSAGAPVVTEITAVSRFHRAEDYHQQYYEKRHG
ncbi:MAG TPA: peptide-methionine (S)-S-oxide reductase MsrA [Gemmatimonadales bacterium]|nr:peptide-methionine (S)-S-oxide reductase MsrA [Gemmatimonadales bacterium]